MISYPGDILQRFGRYEATEDMGPCEQGRLWKAWDPYLERFVLVAALPAADQKEVFRESPDPQALLEQQLGEAFARGRTILDFGPPTQDAPAFFVLPTAEPRRGAAPAPAAPLPAQGERRLARRGALIIAGVAMFTVGAVLGAQLAPMSAPTSATDARRPPLGPAPAPTSAARVEPSRPPAPIATATRQPLAFTRLEPLQGAVRVRTGSSMKFSADVSGAAATRFAWRLDGAQVASAPAFEYAPSRSDPPGVHSLHLTVTDSASGAAIDHVWSIVTEEVNTAPSVRIAAPSRAVEAGKVLVLTADVSDPDEPVGDSVTCAWAIDGEVLSSKCARFEWKVPRNARPGKRIVTLEVRDTQGGSSSDEVAVPIDAPRPTPTKVTAPPPGPTSAAAAAAPIAATPTIGVAPIAPTPTEVAEAKPTATLAAPATPTSAPTEPDTPAPPPTLAPAATPMPENTPVPTARPATVAPPSAGDTPAIAAAITAHNRAQLNAKGLKSAGVKIEVIEVQSDGDGVRVRARRTIELPSQAPQRGEYDYTLTRSAGGWKVVD